MHIQINVVATLVLLLIPRIRLKIITANDNINKNILRDFIFCIKSGLPSFIIKISTN